MYNGKKVCYGTEFFGDIGIVEYQGDYYEDKKLGYGKLYNKKNELVYEGEWQFDQPVNATKLVVTEVFKENAIHFGIEELIIDDNVKNNIKSFTMNGFINSIR